MNTTHTTTTTTAAELRNNANAHDREAAASFDRCDTDGFVSQWASGINAQKDRLQADIIDNGGTRTMIALFDLNGNWVPAKVIDGQYGQSWAVLDTNGRHTGVYAPFHPARRNTMTKRGYLEGYASFPAVAVITGGGRGTGGAASCYVTAVKACPETTPPVAIETTDRWQD